jgi:hypothetical protein
VQLFRLFKNAKYYNCYDKDISDIQNIKQGDNSYNNFIFQAPGGSAGGAIVIFCKQNGQYKIVQEDQGIVECILSITTNGFYDLIIGIEHTNQTEKTFFTNGTEEKYVDSICLDAKHSSLQTVK